LEWEMPEWLKSPPDEILPLVETVDRRFVIAARTVEDDGEHEPRAIDEEERKRALELVDALYRDADYEFVAGVLRLAESDLASDLEETAYRFRSGRLEDLGFPERGRAIEIYAPLDPAKVFAAEEPRAIVVEQPLPAIHAERLTAGLFQQALRAIDDPETARRIESELLALSNAACVAERVEPGDLEHVRLVLDRVRAYLELGLSYGVDAARFADAAKARLAGHPLRTIFRAGHSLTLALSTRARALRDRRALAVGADPLALLAERERVVVEALLARRPQLSRALDDPPLVYETRSFASPADLERAAAVLADLESLAVAARALDLAAVSAALGPGIDPPLAERTADVLLTTAAARAALGGDFGVVPLDGAALGALAGLVGDGGVLPGALVAKVCEAAVAKASEPDAAPAILRRVRAGLATLAETLTALSGAAIDPRFVGGVVREVG
ncbi:DUF6178 family protein, partial [Myxococcota bacterium]|nr:DUF6178 family protein [Myxococcota bacterium]